MEGQELHAHLVGQMIRIMRNTVFKNFKSVEVDLVMMTTTVLHAVSELVVATAEG